MQRNFTGNPQRRIIVVQLPIQIGETWCDITPQDVARFWAKIEQTASCWLWTSTRNPRNGYGSLSIAGLPQYAHRLSWALAHGSIPRGQWVLHSCDVPHCVNPDHLFLGTQKENMADAARKGRLHVARPRRQTVSDAVIAEIKALRAAGQTVPAIARTFRVSTSFVSLVVRGKRRQHPQPRMRGVA